jgi:hypothetical protein
VSYPRADAERHAGRVDVVAAVPATATTAALPCTGLGILAGRPRSDAARSNVIT